MPSNTLWAALQATLLPLVEAPRVAAPHSTSDAYVADAAARAPLLALFALPDSVSAFCHAPEGQAAADAPFGGNAEYLRAKELEFVMAAWLSSVRALSLSSSAMLLMAQCGIGALEGGHAVELCGACVAEYVAARVEPMPLRPRALRLCEELRLSAKETTAMLFVLAMHCGRSLPTSGAVSLSPTVVGRIAAMDAMELTHFVRESRRHMKQGALGFCESRAKLSLGDMRLKMPMEVVTALSGAAVSEEELIKLERTALSTVVLAEGAAAKLVVEENDDDAEAASANGDAAADVAEVDASGEPVRKRARNEDGDEAPAVSKMHTPYATDLDYTDDGFKWLATLIKMRNSESDMKDDDDMYYQNPKNQVEAQLRELKGKHRVLQATMRSRMEATAKAGGWLPRLELMVRKMQLCEAERLILLLLVGQVVSHDILIAINGRYVMRGEAVREVSVGYVLFVLFDTLEKRVDGRKFFQQSGPLIRHGIIRTSIASAAKHCFNTDLMDYLVDIDRKLVDHVVGLDSPTGDMVQGSRIYAPTIPIDNVVLPAETTAAVMSTLKHFELFSRCREKSGFGAGLGSAGGGIVFLFHGPSGTGKTMLANAVASDLKKQVLLVSAQQFRSVADAKGTDVLRYIFREAALHDAIVFFDECETIFESRDSNPVITSLLPEFDKFEGIIIMASNRAHTMDDAMNRRISLMMEFKMPDHTMRERIWRAHHPNITLAADVDFAALALHYELSGGLIKNAFLAALSSSVARDQVDDPTVTMADLSTGAKAQLRGLFQAACAAGAKEQKVYVTPRRSLSDVVVPAAMRADLELVAKLTKSRHTLFTQWGFDEQDGASQNSVCLLYGPPGTGKSLCAEAVAYECGFTMRIENTAALLDSGARPAAAVKTIFDEAKVLGAMVVFDGAERLFTPNETSAEVSRLIEYYAASFSRPVIVIAKLAEGGLSSVDVRLCHINFTHEMSFALPNRALRRQLWRTFVPAQVPTPPGGLDIEELSAPVVSAKMVRQVIFACCAKAALLPPGKRTVTDAMMQAELSHQRELEHRRISATSMFM
jgi:ATP-dependent 26S proteasome regulatory subunit